MTGGDRPTAARALAGGERTVAVGGDIRDSVLVLGDNNVVEVALGSDAILRRLLDEGRLRLTRRPRPRNAPPPPFADHLDRVDEVAAIGRERGHVNVHGSAGVGKTYVLLAALQESDGGRDGTVYLDAGGRGVDDLLGAAWEELHDCEPPLVVAPERRRRDLRDVQATIAIDGAALEPQDAQRLLTEAPAARFVVTSRARVLLQAARVRVRGLPADAVEALVASERCRPLHDDERPVIARLAALLGGHPTRLRQAAALAVDADATLADLVAGLEAAEPVQALSARLQAALEPEDRALLLELAAARGAPVGTALAGALAGRPDAAERLAALENRHLTRSHSPRYTLAGAVAEAPPAVGDDWTLRTAEALAAWAERRDARTVVPEATLLLALLRWARVHGHDRVAIRLGRALDRPLSLDRRWGAWLDSLVAVQEAAARAGDAEAHAWALHQLGTRAYALGDVDGSIPLLEWALDARIRLGDGDGAAATLHNLEFIRGGGLPPADDDTRQDDGGGPHWPGARALVAGVAALVAIVATLVVAAAVAPGGGKDIASSGSGQASKRGDATRPTVTISRPVDGAKLTVGARIRAGFRCHDDSGDVRCAAAVRKGTHRPPASLEGRGWKPVKRGAELPNRFGGFTLAVAASDRSGNTARDTVTYSMRRPGALAACADRADNDGDRRPDGRDPGCESAADNDEGQAVAKAACADEDDNDRDGLVDFGDPGCESLTDNEEADGAAEAACEDGADNDRDGRIDYPADEGCDVAADDDETDAPARGACPDDQGGRLDYPGDEGCDAPAGEDETGAPAPAAPACDDGADNDQDGQIDHPADIGCDAPADDDETGAPTPAACDDGADNDQDGDADHPADEGCDAAADDDETDPPPPTACNDGADNDEDGRIDYPADIGCDSATDETEHDYYY